jgi:drug/metabolite transporter, DME family
MSDQRPATNVRGIGFAAVAIAAALWGTDALFRRGLALDLDAGLIVFIEHVLLVLMTIPLVIRGFRSARSFTAKEWTSIILIGAGASATATILFTHAFTYGDPTTPILLQKLQPLFAILGGWLLLRERLLPRFGVYALLALVGAYFVSFPDPFEVSVSAAAPALLASGAAFLWGMGTVLGRFLSDKVEFKELTALRFAIGLPASLIVVLLRGEMSSLSTIGAKDALALVLLTLIPGLIALMIYYYGLRSTPASSATLAELALPVSALTINYFAFGDVLTSSQWFGLVVFVATITVMSLMSANEGSRRLGVLQLEGAGAQT